MIKINLLLVRGWVEIDHGREIIESLERFQKFELK